MTRYTPLWLQAGSYAGSQDRRLINALWPAAASTGCAVTPQGSTMSVLVATGSVAVPTQNNSGSTLCVSDAIETVGPLNQAPPSGTNRIDLIICRPRGNDLDGGSNTDFIFDFVTGTPAASPAVPATPAGTVALAQISILGGSASIVAGNITDVRPGNLAIPVGQPASAPRGLLANAQGPASAFNAASGTVWTWAPGIAVTPNRKYRLSLWVQGGQQSATSTVIYFTLGDSLGYFTGAAARVIWFGSGLVSGASLAMSSSKMYLPSAAGTPTFTFGVLTGAGTFSIGANFMEATLEDVGGS